MRKEALDEIDMAIDSVFYAASLLRTAGDYNAARRLGDIGDRLHDERLKLSAALRGGFDRNAN